MTSNPQGTLYLVGTPIGNLKDITLRALETLENVDIIAAEDTRQTQKLLNHFGIRVPLTSYHEHNKRNKGSYLIEELQKGKQIALVSDAGMPGISDPGTDIVKACLAGNIIVIPIPGPSAVITGLVASGLDTGGFVFVGFLPRGKKEKQNFLIKIASEEKTLVFYESPHRLKESLEVMKECFGERQCCIGRELTKIHEEFIRGSISEVLDKLNGCTIKGEITLMVEGQKNKIENKASWEDIDRQFQNYLEEGYSKKEAVSKTAKILGFSKREIYNRFMK